MRISLLSLAGVSLILCFAGCSQSPVSAVADPARAAALISDPLDTALSCDHLVIAPASLADAAAALCVYRNGFAGDSVAASRVLSMETVLENFGSDTVTAVRELLRYATVHWRSSPKALVLVGDPAFVTVGRDTIAALYTDIDGDTAADVPIGFVPTTEAAALESWVRRIAEAETVPSSDCALFVDDAWNISNAVDSVYTESIDFLKSAQRLSDSLSGEFNVVTVGIALRDSQPLISQALRDSARTRVLGLIAAQRGMLMCCSHGNSSALSAERIVTSDDAENIHGPSIFVATACETGRLIDTGSCFGRSLIFSESGSVVAFVGSTQLMYQPGVEQYIRVLAHRIASSGMLGRAMDNSVEAIQSVRGNLFLLYGDPATCSVRGKGPGT